MESPRLKIGILVDDLSIQAWQTECLRQIKLSGLGEISVLILNQTPKSAGSKSPFLYRTYRKLDRVLFKRDPDAFENRSIFEVLNPEIPLLKVQPIQGKYSDSFPEKSLEEIHNWDLDMVLRFGFRILKGPILQSANLGVWSYHHGDPAYYRGGPPAFWEVVNKYPISSAVLMQLSEKLDQGQILYQTHTHTDPLSVQRNANKLFWASSFFVERVLRQIHQIGIENWTDQLGSQIPTLKSPLLKPPKTWSMAQLFWSLLLSNTKRKMAEFKCKPHWTIARLKKSSSNTVIPLNPSHLEVWEHPQSDQYYWADPFPFQYKEEEYLLVEEFDKIKQKGRIACLKWNGSAWEIQSYVEESWHLSYPFIWEEEGSICLIPEAGEHGKIYLYQAEDFPKKWIRKSVIFEGEAYDPTLVWKDGLYWLFVNQKAHPACSPFDELYLYYSDKLEPASWISHPQNPIVSDIQKSRPAGKIYEKDGKWYRPAQDSGLRYGHRVHVQEILCWDTQFFQEQTIQTLEPDPNSKLLGVHTYNESFQGIYLDLYFRR